MEMMLRCSHLLDFVGIMVFSHKEMMKCLCNVA